jgi:intracellular sulfur oxidation DsrE/DsrF family protein
MQSIIRHGLAAALLAIAVPGVAMADDPVKVVYHVNEGVEKAPAVLRNIANHLDAEPSTRIVVVAHGPGIDFLLKGAKDKNGNTFDSALETLEMRGVQFDVCNNTLTSRHIDRSRVVSEAKIVPSGVAEIGRLESKEGYVYLKP